VAGRREYLPCLSAVRADRFDITYEYKMPDKDGWEVLKELKKLTLRLK